MNAEEMFEAWWADQVRGGTDMSDAVKFSAWNGWLAAREATAKRCVEICRGHGQWGYAADAIEREFGMSK